MEGNGIESASPQLIRDQYFALLNPVPQQPTSGSTGVFSRVPGIAMDLDIQGLVTCILRT